MSRKEQQGGFTVEIPDDVALGRPVNYVNVNVDPRTGNVVLDMGLIAPRQGQEKPEAIVSFRAGTNVSYLRALHAILNNVFQSLDSGPPAPAAPSTPGGPPTGGAQIN